VDRAGARPARLAGGHARRAGRRTAHRRHRGRDADRRPQVPPGKTGVVQNFPEASFAQADGAGAPAAERAEAFVYAGGLMEVQGAREMAQAFALLPPGMTGTIAGTFHPPELEREIAAMPGWRRVRYLGQVPRADVVQAMTRAGRHRAEPPDAQLRRRLPDEDVRIYGAGYRSCARTSRCGPRSSEAPTAGSRSTHATLKLSPTQSGRERGPGAGPPARSEGAAGDRRAIQLGDGVAQARHALPQTRVTPPSRRADSCISRAVGYSVRVS
jgi:predicted nucleic acid-binding Zn ribbon protein